MRNRGMWGIVGAVALAALLAGCSHGTPPASRKPPGSSTSTTSPTGGSKGPTTTTTTATATAVDEAASLPVVDCPTQFAITTPQTAPVPASLTVDVPTALAGKLAVYTDSDDIVKLLAPTGWTCSASYGADGSGGITIAPTGESLSAGELDPNSSKQAITASETGGSPVQAAAAACSFFPAAAAAKESDLGMGCAAHPTSDVVDPISTSVVAFEDPVGIRGSGYLSGGQNPVNGVMTYSPTQGPGFYLGTCILPQDEHATCTAVLNYFIALYGQG